MKTEGPRHMQHWTGLKPLELSGRMEICSGIVCFMFARFIFTATSLPHADELASMATIAVKYTCSHVLFWFDGVFTCISHTIRPIS